jgi:peptidoglycan/LPS O-acetylase OafA/YrhL
VTFSLSFNESRVLFAGIGVKDLKKTAIAERSTRQRVIELDGLRGIAALWVVFYHLWGAIQERNVDWVPGAISGFLHAGWLGVDIFFVLSGFVITHSVANIRVTPTFVPKFILRRSIRIDPPYWAAIGLAIAFMILKNTFFPAASVPLPSFMEIVAHIFYLQDLLGFGNISSVFWTLCLEFQFYLIFGIVYHFYNSLGESAKRRYSLVLLLSGMAFCGLSPALRFSSFNLPFQGTPLCLMPMSLYWAL